MSNSSEHDLSNKIEQFLMEKEALWKLAEDIPKWFADNGMPLRGQSIICRPDVAGDRYILILLIIPGNGCQFCGFAEDKILKNRPLAPKNWLVAFDSIFTVQKLRLCPNCYTLFHLATKRRFDSALTEREFSAFLLQYSYERTTNSLDKKNHG